MANQRNHGDNSPAKRSPSPAETHGNDSHGKSVEKQSQQPPNADNHKKHGEPNEQGASGGHRSSDKPGKR